MPTTPHKNDTWRNRTHPIQEDMAFQRATWRAQRIGWAILWLIMVLALLGLFSEGLLSTSSAVSPGGELRVTYGRFQRSGAPAEVKIQVEPQQNREVAIRIGREMLEAFSIESMVPAPQAERGAAGGVELLFPAAAGEPLTVYLTVRPHSAGLVEYGIALGEARAVELSQFIYP